MDISISNIALHNVGSRELYHHIRSLGAQHVDVAPTILWPNWEYEEQVSQDFLSLVTQADLTVAGMQSLFFGLPELNILSQSDAEWSATRHHFELLTQMATTVGARCLVLGSPANRVPTSACKVDVRELATDRLGTLADICGAASIHLCIEPVPRVAGGKFLTTTTETAEFVRGVKHKYLKMNLDIAVLHGESQHFQRSIDEVFDTIGHVHASEPDLQCFASPICDHKGAGAVLRSNQFSGVVAIEMLTAKENLYRDITTALSIVSEAYG